MGDRGGAFIGFQTRLRRVGCVGRTIYEHVIPRLVSIRLSLLGLIPRLVGPAGHVKVHDHAAVPVSPVSHDLARVIERVLFGSFGFRRRLLEHDHRAVLAAHIVGATGVERMDEAAPNARVAGTAFLSISVLIATVHLDPMRGGDLPRVVMGRGARAGDITVSTGVQRRASAGPGSQSLAHAVTRAAIAGPPIPEAAEGSRERS